MRPVLPFALAACSERDARTARLGRRAVRRRAGAFLGTARSAAHAHSRGAGRDRRHSDRPHLRAVSRCASTRSASSEAAEYLEMAARLLRIKVQMLLPRRGDDEEWDDPRAELVRRLLEYQQMREVVDMLRASRRDRRDRFARGVSAADRPRRRSRRSRSRFPSCSPPWIACCALRASRSCTTSCRARSTSTARSTRSSRCSRIAGTRGGATSSASTRAALAGAVRAARAARARAPQRAAARAAASLCQRGDPA